MGNPLEGVSPDLAGLFLRYCNERVSDVQRTYQVVVTKRDRRIHDLEARLITAGIDLPEEATDHE